MRIAQARKSLTQCPLHHTKDKLKFDVMPTKLIGTDRLTAPPPTHCAIPDGFRERSLSRGFGSESIRVGRCQRSGWWRDAGQVKKKMIVDAPIERGVSISVISVMCWRGVEGTRFLDSALGSRPTAWRDVDWAR